MPMDLGEKYREINRMVDYFTNLYRSGSISYDVNGRPSEIGCANMTLSTGRYSYNVIATNDRVRVEGLGLKPFPDQIIKFDDIEDMEYNENYIMFKYGGHILYLDLMNCENTYLKEIEENEGSV